MDKFPLLRDGQPAGELIAEREALYTWFEARCPLPGGGPLVRLGRGGPGGNCGWASWSLWGIWPPSGGGSPRGSPIPWAASSGGEIRPPVRRRREHGRP